MLDILDSPASESKSFITASSNQRDTELFEIIEKLQGSRIDEQRCEFPLPLKSQDLTIGGDLPLVLPSESGGYWIDPPLERLVDVSPTSCQHGLHPERYDIMERDGEARIYHTFFRSRVSPTPRGTPYLSFTGVSILSSFPPAPSLVHSGRSLMKESTLHGLFSLSLFPNIPSAVELAKVTNTNAFIADRSFHICVSLVPQAPELITAFDEHRVSLNFKFGILCQTEGQVSEEDILSNNGESEEFVEFLSVLGETVQLQGFTGFRGGLDVCHGQTGSEAVYTSFHGREIMFHVATKLPFTDGDPQQLQRKRHIGNDIVALVYQEGNTPFLSDVIKSHFLHCFLVVRRIQSTEGMDKRVYQVSVTAREDVPPFGPALPDPPIFTERSLLREFLLTKLINAEISCYKAQQFSRLELRTRSSLLENLQAELSTRSRCMMGDPSTSTLASAESARGTSEGSGGFIENFKRAIRVRSHSFETLGVPKKVSGSTSQKPKVRSLQGVKHVWLKINSNA
uniref:Si:ch1073-90m23.1 n=1 Tax=Takifugu rubripes TaxID=31033 RepID=H2ULA2_TAKRU